MAEKSYQPETINYGQEPGKLNICSFGTLWTSNVSSERFLFEKFDFSQVKNREKHTKNAPAALQGRERSLYENRTEKAGKDH